MKKLFLSLVLILCSVTLSSSAFAADADAYTLYRDAVKKLKAVKSIEYFSTMKFSALDGSEYMEYLNTSMTAKALLTANKTLHMSQKFVDHKRNTTEYTYVKDDVTYIRTSDTKYKITHSGYGEQTDFISNICFSYIDLDLPKDKFKGAKVERVDGGTKITCKESESYKNDYTKTISWTTTTTIIIDDGIIKSYSVSTTSPIIGGGKEDSKLKSSQTTKIKSVNTLLKIDFPPDLNTYKELEL